jgi:UDP-GlcNAc:undecaprenyl-phosphate GlcNAc-1-phosphate transferase
MLMSFLIAIFITPWTKKLAIQKQILDHPSEVKIHAEPVPRTGGIAIVIAFLISSFLLLGFTAETRVLLLILAILIIVGIGMADDVTGLTPIQKLAGQTIAALIFAVSEPFIGNFSPILGGIFAFLFVLLVCNAVNLIDGLDGLAAGLSAIASIGFMILGLLMNNPLVVGLSAILAGGSLGFLPYNWFPAGIFMGDTGSLFLGFALAAIGVISIQKADYFAEILIPIIILGVPIFDTVLTILRRIINKKALFSADLAHSYNLIQKRGLAKRGLTTKGVVVFYYGLGVLLSICGVLIEYMLESNLPILLLLFVIALLAFLVVKFRLLAEE